MKNLLHKDPFFVQLLSLIGQILGEILTIIIGLFRILAKLLWKFRRWEYRFAIMFFILYSAYTAILPSVYAPKSAYALNGQDSSIPTLNPNVDQREQVKLLIKKIWGNDSWVGMNIARCESGFTPEAKNHNTDGSWDIGIFQVNTVHQMPEMMNVVANISYAYTIYLAQGTAPWVSSKHCWGEVIK